MAGNMDFIAQSKIAKLTRRVESLLLALDYLNDILFFNDHISEAAHAMVRMHLKEPEVIPKAKKKTIKNPSKSDQDKEG